MAQRAAYPHPGEDRPAVEDALAEIQRLQNAIISAEAKSLPDAAVQLRRLAVLLENQDSPLLRLQAPSKEDGRTMRHLLGSALAAVETAGATAQPPKTGVSSR